MVLTCRYLLSYLTHLLTQRFHKPVRTVALYRNSVQKYDEISLALQLYGIEQGPIITHTAPNPKTEAQQMIHDEIQSTYATDAEIAEVGRYSYSPYFNNLLILCHITITNHIWSFGAFY